MTKTYTDLKTQILSLLDDDSPEFVAYIPTAINLAEQRVIRDTDYVQYVTTSIVNPATGDFKDPDLGEQIDSGSTPEIVPVVNFFDNGNVVGLTISDQQFLVKLTTGISGDTFLYFTNVYINNTVGTKSELRHVESSFIEEYLRQNKVVEFPRFYAMNGGPEELIIAPLVSSVDFNTITLEYVKEPDPLVETTNETNILTQKANDLLYVAAISEMAQFMKNWETVGVWEQKYQSLLNGHLNTSRRERKDVGEGHNNPANVVQSATGAN